MSTNVYKNRAYGFILIKSLNSNYNADFSGQPRTLPDGKVYATDKTPKYCIRNFINVLYPEKKVFSFKRMNENLNPYTLAESYNNFYDSDVSKEDKKTIIKNLLSAIDIRFFGITFAPKGTNIKDKNISIHGPVQINHGVNIWHEDFIYSEQILSPFRNPSEKKDSGENEEKAQSTTGRQSRLEEGHYLHHFSINPKNLEDKVKQGGEGTEFLTEEDISLLKEGLRKGVTFYDSASKAGTENEILFYVELKENSKLVLPNFSEMVEMSDSKDNGKRYFDFGKVKSVLSKHAQEISVCEIYFNENQTCIENLPEGCKQFDL
jgi:CRISPR-associated protein Csh2